MAVNKFLPHKHCKKNRKICCDCCGCLIAIPNPTMDFQIPLSKQQCKECFTLYFANDSYSGVNDSGVSSIFQRHPSRLTKHSIKEFNANHVDPVSSNCSECHMLDLVLSPNTSFEEWAEKRLNRMTIFINIIQMLNNIFCYRSIDTDKGVFNFMFHSNRIRGIT